MFELIKRVSYKVLVTYMIVIVFSFFCISSVSHAKLTVDDGEFYYTGTQDATYTVEVTTWEDILHALAEVANYILGACTLALRGTVVGWIEIFEMLLTKILSLADSLGTVNENAMTSYTQKTVNVETIIFNRVPIFDANIFSNNVLDANDNSDGEFITRTIKNAVAKWYYIMRLVVIVLMLILLIYIGIKIAISSIASEKAVYKGMLVDWVVGMIIIFSIHYIMIFIVNINDDIVASLEPLVTEQSEIQEEYEYGDEKFKKKPSEIETTLYETARTRAYDLKLTDGFTGMCIYGVLVYYAWRFAMMYFKRICNIIMLTLLAPAVSASYAFNKVMSGKSKVFSTWLQEYVMNVIIQIVHVILYVSFVSIALELSLKSLVGTILAFVILNFMLKADKIFRQLFNLSGGKGSLIGDMVNNSSFRSVRKSLNTTTGMIMGGKITKMAMKSTYRVATKPIRTVAENQFTKAMIRRANDEKFKQKSINELKKIEDEYNEFRNKKEQDKEWDEIYRQKIALLEKKKDLQEKQLKLSIENNSDSSEKVEKQLKAVEKQLQLNQSRVDEFETVEEAKKEAFLLNYMSDSDSVKDVFLKNLSGAFDPKKYLKQDKDGNWIRRETRRVGGNNKAFWRKKEDGVGKRFFENMKWDKLLGIEENEKKILQQQTNFWKSTISGVIAAIAGFPALAINAELGFALLGQAAVSRVRVGTRKRMNLHRAEEKNYKSYKFKSFAGNAEKVMTKEAQKQLMLAESRMTKNNMKNHPKLVKILQQNTIMVAKKIAIGSITVTGLGMAMPLQTKIKVRDSETTRFTTKKIPLDTLELDKMNGAYQKKLRKEFKYAKKQWVQLETDDLVKQYSNEMNEYEKNVIKQNQRKSISELYIQDEIANGDAVSVGDTIVSVKENDNITKFISNIEIIDSKDISREQKIDEIKEEISKNKVELIEESVVQLCVSKRINDIRKLDMNNSDNIIIQRNLIDNLEKKGIIKKGEINSEEIVSQSNITNVYDSLVKTPDKINDMIEKKIVKDAYLEYIAKENVTDLKKLKTNDAKQEIYDIIKEKMMSETSKESAQVIKNITGSDIIKNDFELNNSILTNVDQISKKVKKFNVNDFNINNKEKLIERQVNREINDTKNQFEKVMYTDDDEVTVDENALNALFLLSKIGQQNFKAEKVGDKRNYKKKDTKAMLNYYQLFMPNKKIDNVNDGSKKFDNTKDGSRRVNQNMDGNQDLTKKIKQTETRVHGYSKDVIELINSIENR